MSPSGAIAVPDTRVPSDGSVYNVRRARPVRASEIATVYVGAPVADSATRVDTNVSGQPTGPAKRVVGVVGSTWTCSGVRPLAIRATTAATQPTAATVARAAVMLCRARRRRA